MNEIVLKQIKLDIEEKIAKTDKELSSKRFISEIIFNTGFILGLRIALDILKKYSEDDMDI